MLRFSIMTGMILSTLNPHSLKAFDDDSDGTRTPLVTLTTLFKPSETVSLDALRNKLIAIERMGQNGVGFLIDIKGTLVEVARLYPDNFKLNKDWGIRDRQGRKRKERHKKLSKFKKTHEDFIKELDILSKSRFYNELSISTHYASIASAEDEVAANLEIGYLALTHRNDKRILLEIFKGIPTERRKIYFNTLLFKSTPHFALSLIPRIKEAHRTRIKEAHKTLRTLKEEIMGLPFDSSKTDLLAILKSLCIKSLFEEEK